jgi:endonuclease III
VGRIGDSIVPQLREFYGLLPQPPSDPFQFFVWEILSADALPARRDLAWQALRRVPALTPDAMARTPQAELLEVARIIGPRADERLERIRATTGEMKRHRETLDPDRLRTRGLTYAARVFRRLAHLPRDVLNRALVYAAGYPVLPLDDGAARVVMRIEGQDTTAPGASHHQQRRQARRLMASRLPVAAHDYGTALLYLRHHAEHTCSVTPHCRVCPLAARCKSAKA